MISQYIYGYDLAGNRASEQVGLGVTTSSFNNLNQTTGASAGGPLQFTGTLSKPGTVTVGGNAATMDSTFENFSGTANATTGNNTVPVVATSVNGYAATNNYQVELPSGSSVTPTYDADGNLTSNGNGQAYTWDAENELTAITYSSGSNSGNHTEFTYDGLGRRIAIVERAGTTIGRGTIASTTQFVWIGSAMAEARDATGTNVTNRFYSQGEQINGANYYYTRDQLGSVREMTDNTGTIQARYDYDPNGQVTKVSGSMDSDFQYAEYYIHVLSGLNLTLFRAYDASVARWLSRDPIGEHGGINLYGYVFNNPINSFDPLGLLTYFESIFGEETDGYRTDALNFVDGVDDSLTFGLSEKLREDLGANEGYNPCSGAYKGGEIASFALGVGRLAYAGAVKALPLVYNGTDLAAAQAISQARNTLKLVFRGGLFPNSRMPSFAEIAERYGGDPQKIIKAATRTNTALNTLGADAATGSVYNYVRSGCGCP